MQLDIWYFWGQQQLRHSTGTLATRDSRKLFVSTLFPTRNCKGNVFQVSDFWFDKTFLYPNTLTRWIEGGVELIKYTLLQLSFSRLAYFSHMMNLKSNVYPVFIFLCTSSAPCTASIPWALSISFPKLLDPDEPPHQRPWQSLRLLQPFDNAQLFGQTSKTIKSFAHCSRVSMPVSQGHVY